MFEVIAPSAEELTQTIPLSSSEHSSVSQSRTIIQAILEGRDPRTLCIVGPCSIHMHESGIEYAEKLKNIADLVKDSLYIVFRGYLEKPRTLDGWRGFLFDPDLDGTYDIFKGIELSRGFLKEIVQLDLPIAYEFVDPLLKHYIQDLVSWGCIGARTCQSPTHRQLASTLPFPVGFKNTTSGDIAAAVHAACISYQPQTIIENSLSGQLTLKKSHGNPMPHIVLRGSKSGPNYGSEYIKKTEELLLEHEMKPSILIDCSHDNCGYSPAKQQEVAFEIVSKLHSMPSVKGFMLESFLMSGKQDDYRNTPQFDEACRNASKVDACLGWEETKEFLIYTHKTLKKRI